MEAQAALERAQRAAHLDAEAAVDVDLAGVVHPGDSKEDHPLRLEHPLQDPGPPVLRMLLEQGSQRSRHLGHRFKEIRLVRMPGGQVRQQGVHVGGGHGTTFANEGPRR